MVCASGIYLIYKVVFLTKLVKHLFSHKFSPSLKLRMTIHWIFQCRPHLQSCALWTLFLLPLPYPFNGTSFPKFANSDLFRSWPIPSRLPTYPCFGYPFLSFQGLTNADWTAILVTIKTIWEGPSFSSKFSAVITVSRFRNIPGVSTAILQFMADTETRYAIYWSGPKRDKSHEYYLITKP